MNYIVELASDPDARVRGLMNRADLQGADGMLFLFDRPTTDAFWNSHTLLPLDLFYLDRDGRIIDRMPMQSISETAGRVVQYMPRVPYVAALELLRHRIPVLAQPQRVSLLADTLPDNRRVIAIR